MKKLLAAITLPIVMTACVSTADSDSVTTQDLQHHHWVLSEIDGKAVNVMEHFEAPDIEIGEHMKANGNAGCNRYFGQAELKDGQFRIEKMGMTMKMCPDEPMELERTMTNVLTDWSDISLTKESLILKSDQHELTFTLRDWVN